MSGPPTNDGPPPGTSSASGRGRLVVAWSLGALVVGAGAVLGVLLLTGGDPPETAAPVGDVDGPPTEREEMSARELAATLGDAVWKVEAEGCDAISTGTAFAIGRRTLVTNWHVTVNDVTPALVSRDGSTRLDGVVLGWEEQPDVAVIEVDEDLPLTLDWIGADELGEGQELVALGFPVPGTDFTVTQASILSFQQGGGQREAIRADGLIDKGNSGGPALTLDGRVAGIVTEMADNADGFQLFPLLYTHDHVRDTLDRILAERPGAEADCGDLGGRPEVPDGWDVDPIEVDGPDTYGDDPTLDEWWDLCELGDLAACDVLYWDSPIGSVYEAFGATCGDRGEPVHGACSGDAAPTGDTTWTFGDDPELDGLATRCDDGDMAACDELYWTSPYGSEYEAFGASCGERREPSFGECDG